MAKVRFSLEHTIIGAFSLLAFAGAACADTPSGPLDRLLTSKTDSLCYRRDYDAAHLAKNPAQRTQAIMLSFRKDAVRVELRRKGEATPLYIVASCAWSDTANHDVQGTWLLPTFRKSGGYDCIVLVTPSSAEEGGYAVLDPAADGQSLTLHLDDGEMARRGLGKNVKPAMEKFGRDDRVFKMARTDAAACKPMDDALEGP